MTKKQVIRIFWRENGNFFPKKRHSEILVREQFFRPPKLGARYPPLAAGPCRACVSNTATMA